MKAGQLARIGVERFTASIGARLDGSPLALLLDVDGTLAPIVPRPEAAAIPPKTREVLGRLIALPGIVIAFVSGRSADDTWRIARLDGALVLGNHGLELRDAHGKVTANDAVHVYEPAIASAVHLLRNLERSVTGVIVEDKRWTLSVHYRLVKPSAASEVIQRAHEVARQLGLRAFEGKKIVELRPPVDLNKGTAALELADRIGATHGNGSVLYAGDDRTDEDAFVALRARASHAVTVRVASDDGEDQPSPPPTNAEYVLASPSEFREVLEWLVTRRHARAGAIKH